MRFQVAVVLCCTFVFAGAAALGQDQAGAQGGQQAGQETAKPVVRFSDGGASVSITGTMENLYISPKPGAPFSMKVAAEWSKPMDGGGTFTLANERSVARDSKGRIYEERWILVPKGGDVKSWMNVFQLADPEQHTLYNCWTRSKVCDLLRFDDVATAVYQPRLRQAGPLPDGKGYVRVEDLGAGTVEGMETHGYRETTTFKPGTMGNNREMSAVREFWFSPQLGINLSSTVNNPQTGRQVFTVKDLTTSEPEASVFEVPEGYRVVDKRSKENRH
jgi:hypothetical protein